MYVIMHAVLPAGAYPAGTSPRATDTITIQNGIYTIVRDHHEILRVNLNEYSTPQDQPYFFGSAPYNHLFWVKRMPGIVATLVSVHEAANGTITFNFSDGSGRSLDSWTDAAEVAAKYESSDVFPQEALIAKSYRNSPDGTNKTTMVGASFSADLSANQPFNFTSEEG